MKPDLYTKGVLTVIAFALLLLVARSFQNPAPALAQSGVQHVIIDGVSGVLQGIPVVITDPLGKTLHVTVDDVGPTLSLLGLPVRQTTTTAPPEKLRKWEYKLDTCGDKWGVLGADGWEAFQVNAGFDLLPRNVWFISDKGGLRSGRIDAPDLPPGSHPDGATGKRVDSVAAPCVAFYKRPSN